MGYFFQSVFILHLDLSLYQQCWWYSIFQCIERYIWYWAFFMIFSIIVACCGFCVSLYLLYMICCRTTDCFGLDQDDTIKMKSQEDWVLFLCVVGIDIVLICIFLLSVEL